MMDQEQIPQEDIVDAKILELVDWILDGDEDEEQIDHATDIIFELAKQLVDDGEIQEIPDTDVSDSEKQKWIDESFPKLKAAIEAEEDSEEI